MRYGQGLKTLGRVWWIAPLVPTVLILIVRYVPTRWAFALRTGLLAILIAYAVWFAWSLRWLSDDAYISFRYAENLVRGHGLVFNVGERVEGYTDFLWTILIAAFIKLGFDPGKVALVICLASDAALMVVMTRLSARLAPVANLPLGVGPILATLSYTVASFATGGLETLPAALLCIWSLERLESRAPVWSGVLGVGAILAHPDHAIFYAALAVALFTHGARRRELVRYLAPFVLIFVPYFLWRWSYYGDLMPNTYYAKSADRTYFRQGLVYLAVGVMGAAVWAALPLAVFGAYRARATLTARFAAIALPVYLYYVAKIGGDFMLGRLFVPVLAIVFLLADLGFRELLRSAHLKTAGLLAALSALTVFPVRLVKPGEIFFGIADERTFTPLTDFDSMQIEALGWTLGHTLEREFARRRVQPKVAIYSLGMAGYYSNLPIFDLRGLTSREVAHMPLVKRDRPGHEKEASLGHVLEAHVDISELAVYPDPYLSSTRLGSSSLYFVRYVPEWVQDLSSSLKPRDFPAQVDRELGAFARRRPERVACDLWHMREYYFSRNDDLPRRAAVSKAAVLADPNLRAVEKLLLESRELSTLGARKIRGFSFGPEEPAWTASGAANSWGRAPVLPEQGLPFGQNGPFLNTFTRADGEASQGTARSAPFMLEGDVITFRIAGGQNRERLRFALLVDGTSVRDATGCQSEWLGNRIWDVAPWKGRNAELLVVDETGGGWGHLLVDEIVEWQLPPELRELG